MNEKKECEKIDLDALTDEECEKLLGKSIVQYEVDGRLISEEEYADLIRKQYVTHPPAGYTADEISRMSNDTLLDMDYFLNE